MHLQYLWDCGQPFRDRIVAAGLADLERDKRGDLVAERRRIHVRAVSGDHAALSHPVQAGLDRAAGGAEPTGRLEHAHPRLGGQQFNEGGIQCDKTEGATEPFRLQAAIPVSAALSMTRAY